jgi:protein gp37
MGDKSSIEWTDATWNPVTGCDRTSPGCDNCYALTLAKRLKAMGSPHYQVDGDPRTSGPGFAVQQHDDALELPLRWARPRLVFVNSMSDLFHPAVSATFIGQVFAVMAATPQHTYQVLTKRPERARQLLLRSDVEDHIDYLAFRQYGHRVDWCRHEYPVMGEAGWLPNVWLGTSIELDRYVWRADRLRHTPAAVRFLSCEPLLGPLPSLNLGGIDWVIAGGESGPGARPMDPDWVRDLRDRCTDADVAFHFKQWGRWVPYEEDPQPPFWESQHGDFIDGHHLPADLSSGDRVGGWWAPHPERPIFRNVGKRTAGRTLDGRTWDEFPPEARR